MGSSFTRGVLTQLRSDSARQTIRTLTSDAVTSAPASFVWTMLGTLVVVYALIAAVFVMVLVRLAARWSRQDRAEAPEVGAPYGPRAPTFPPQPDLSS